MLKKVCLIVSCKFWIASWSVIWKVQLCHVYFIIKVKPNKIWIKKKQKENKIKNKKITLGCTFSVFCGTWKKTKDNTSSTQDQRSQDQG